MAPDGGGRSAYHNGMRALVGVLIAGLSAACGATSAFAQVRTVRVELPAATMPAPLAAPTFRPAAIAATAVVAPAVASPAPASLPTTSVAPATTIKTSSLGATVARRFAELAASFSGRAAESIDLDSGRSVPLHRASDGSRYVYLFPFRKTPVTFIDGEPHVVVYRGLRDAFDPTKASGSRFGALERVRKILGEPAQTEGDFGSHIYTSLDPRVAIRYLNGTLITGAERLTLLRMRLPLKKAYIAKWSKDSDPRGSYFRALENRLYLWFNWSAPVRRREKELVWDLRELGGDLSDPRYDVHSIQAEVKQPVNPLEWPNFDNEEAAVRAVEADFQAGRWTKTGR